MITIQVIWISQVHSFQHTNDALPGHTLSKKLGQNYLIKAQLCYLQTKCEHESGWDFPAWTLEAWVSISKMLKSNQHCPKGTGTVDDVNRNTVWMYLMLLIYTEKWLKQSQVVVDGEAEAELPTIGATLNYTMNLESVWATVWKYHKNRKKSLKR